MAKATTSSGDDAISLNERLIYSVGLSEESAREPAEGGPPGTGEPGAPEPPRLRKRPFGYKRADVDAVLETRDSQVAELRQDIAALWLAFAQHDRMLRDLAGELEGDAPPPEPQPEPHAAAFEDVAEGTDDDAVEGAESIGQQLSDLDEVLAAIEMATQTLERSYVEGITVAEGEGKQAKDAATETDEPDR